MGLPSILDGIRKRTSVEKSTTPEDGDATGTKESTPPSADCTLISIDEPSTLTRHNIKKATKVRKGFAISASVSSFLSLIFLILVSPPRLNPIAA